MTDTAKPAPFMVGPKWRGSKLMLVEQQVGRISYNEAADTFGAFLERPVGPLTHVGWFATSAEARAAVEAAVRERYGVK